MAFTQTGLERSFNQVRGAFATFVYRTNDTIAEVLTNGYFNRKEFGYVSIDAAPHFVDVFASDGYITVQYDFDNETSIKADGLPSSVDLNAVVDIANINPVANPAFKIGVNIALFGASITQGTGSTNASSTSYGARLKTVYIDQNKASSIIRYGYPGESAVQLLDRIPDVLAGNPDIVILGPDFMTNGPAVSYTDIEAAYVEHISTFLKAGVKVMCCATLPAASTETAVNNAIQTRRLIINNQTTHLGLPLIDTFSPMIDDATGYLNATLDSDGIHPNNAGHDVLADAISLVLSPLLVSYGLPVQLGSAGMLADPFALNAGSWPANVGSANGTRLLEAAPDLPAGGWVSYEIDGNVSVGNKTMTTLINGWNVGDEILIVGYYKISDFTKGDLSVKVTNQSSVNIAIIKGKPVKNDPIPFVYTLTVPAGTTFLNFGITVTAGAGEVVKGSIGYTQAYNMTQLGIAI